jgi:ethanolamine utilization protein EutQ (cupin superfamily)
MAEVKYFRPNDFDQTFNDRGTSVHEFVNEKDNSAFSCGITYMRDSDFDWTLWYDEMLICIDPGELFEVVVDGRTYSLAKDDSIWLPKGTIARYRSIGLALVYAIISPADWRKDAQYIRYRKDRE